MIMLEDIKYPNKKELFLCFAKYKLLFTKQGFYHMIF
jgi:hypothetical protein